MTSMPYDVEPTEEELAPPMLVYLASPYSHGDAAVEQRRVDAADEAARLLLDAGGLVYSPLSHFAHGRMRQVSARVAYAHGLGMLSVCDVLLVLCLPGWQDSKGVADEIALADAMSMPYVLVEPNADEELLDQLVAAMGVLQTELAEVCGCGSGESCGGEQ